jgi:SH3-like domain-containing protein|tara:strand:+ start:1725 stop:2171 length:447 start_codon:yes stop_codon:yes gene_type:complete
MKKIIYITLLILLTSSTLANENNYFLSLKNKKVNVRYGPGFDYPIKYIYKKIFLPLEVIDNKENFRRIIDFKKNSGWIHISQLKKNNSLIVLGDKILFSKSSKFSKPLAKLEKGRLLIIKKCKNNWCKIKTESYSGWIETTNIWGTTE